jgi:ATP-dependent helicase YprA (DUF1998 family)
MSTIYSANTVVHGLRETLHQYLEAQYHIWDEDIVAERRRLFDAPGTTYQEPWVESTPFYVARRSYQELNLDKNVKEFLQRLQKLDVGVFDRPYEHQAVALERIVTEKRDVIVATGTGSGKTESFLFPIIAQLVLESIQAPKSTALPGCRAILLYPMNALVNDQVARLRRLFGNQGVAAEFKSLRKRPVRFGMYTGRTPYAGPRSSQKDVERLGSLFEKLFLIPDEKRQQLEIEGKWPSKDMAKFQASGYVTDSADRELFTRHEMQASCPDLLVTNYSMLEYMLLRPIESPIFAQTRDWLASNNENTLFIVIDEAHMYRGAAGAEVAMLLRRLQSRLGVDRDRLRYILTSASLGSSDDATQHISQFAADLTGLQKSATPFDVIKGTIEEMEDLGDPGESEKSAFAEIDTRLVNEFAVNLESARKEINKCLVRIELPAIAPTDREDELRDVLFDRLHGLKSARRLARLTTGNAIPYAALAVQTFGDDSTGISALDSLIALCCIAKRIKDGRVFLPLRLHLLFRGVSGIYACVNPRCTKRRAGASETYLGALFASPRINCECGARVYELLTHRDCGAAFLRGYVRGSTGDFLWHEPTKYRSADADALVEAHFLVEADRARSADGRFVWLHTPTGRLKYEHPGSSMDEFIELVRAPDKVSINGRDIYSFDGECPVCRKKWRQEASKIMDLVTKGEAPFAHLIKTQVMMQPPHKPESPEFPNAGRKSLLFSDGRQKAARLARDIPREVERDVFRQVLVLAVDELKKIDHPEWARPDLRIFTSMLHVLAKYQLQLFDGESRLTISDQVGKYKHRYGNDLKDAIDDQSFTSVPPEYRAHLIRQLCHPFYSLHALTIAYLEPRQRIYTELHKALAPLSKDEVEGLACTWIQNLLKQFAFDDVPYGIRASAAGYPRKVWGESKEFPSVQRKVLEKRLTTLPAIEGELARLLGKPSNGALVIDPSTVVVRLALDDVWLQCLDCSFLSAHSLLGMCPNCMGSKLRQIHPESSQYLRARKTFWRDPIVAMLRGESRPRSIDVEEHTAQLAYLDVDEPTATTEEYERRFRDILVHEGDTPIDVLSSTTTMEVGIDIGSLVAVGLRNVPPMRQNYQQRAGRAGRRGASVSTVITYAQNNPHDNYYFRDPRRIIAGEAPLPAIDIRNERIVRRHIYAVLLQTFFHSQVAGLPATNDIYSVLGETLSFYDDSGQFSIRAFKTWLGGDMAAGAFKTIESWLPSGTKLVPKIVAEDFLKQLEENRPTEPTHLDDGEKRLIDFLFSRGLLPAYAFPRDLCALQIEGRLEKVVWGEKVRVLERPQQGMNVALGEYAPGRLVVINKKTYRVGSVAASLPSSVVNRAAPLFDDVRRYISCPECGYSEKAASDAPAPAVCPSCSGGEIRALDVIQPEAVFPDGCEEIDEYDDEETRTTVTSAQLPVVQDAADVSWKRVYVNGEVASAENQLLVMMNTGDDSVIGGTGFRVCNMCGKATLPGSEPTGPHERDYRISWHFKKPKYGLCHGSFQSVVLGYNFLTDVMLLRVPLKTPLISDLADPSLRRPLEDALSSLAVAISSAAAHLLDIDVRELNSGHRFIRNRDQTFAEVFLYDALAGGAGYASQSAARIKDVFVGASELLSNCDCQSSCDKCLRHYGNRLEHESLDRYLALDLLRYIQAGDLPRTLTIENQRRVLDPLKRILELEGWVITQLPAAAFVAKYEDQSYVLAAIPALIDPDSIANQFRNGTLLFSTYDLQRDLPGAFSRLTRG